MYGLGSSKAGLEVKSVNHKLKSLTWHQKRVLHLGSHLSHLPSTGLSWTSRCSTMLSASDVSLHWSVWQEPVSVVRTIRIPSTIVWRVRKVGTSSLDITPYCLRDLIAEIWEEVFSDVEVEPPLLPLTGEKLPRGSRFKVASSFYELLHQTFIDLDFKWK